MPTMQSRSRSSAMTSGMSVPGRQAAVDGHDHAVEVVRLAHEEAHDLRDVLRAAGPLQRDPAGQRLALLGAVRVGPGDLSRAHAGTGRLARLVRPGDLSRAHADRA